MNRRSNKLLQTLDDDLCERFGFLNLRFLISRSANTESNVGIAFQGVQCPADPVASPVCVVSQTRNLSWGRRPFFLFGFATSPCLSLVVAFILVLLARTLFLIGLCFLIGAIERFFPKFPRFAGAGGLTLLCNQ